jgi:hypothetical protein
LSGAAKEINVIKGKKKKRASTGDGQAPEGNGSEEPDKLPIIAPKLTL